MTVYSAKNTIPVKESGNLGSIHFYGMSKKWAEEAIISCAQRGLIKALILRYPGLYGYPRENGYIFNITRKLLNNENISIDTRGLKFWEAINIEDAAEITAKIIERWDWKKKFEIMNCSYGEEVDFIKTAFKIKDIVHSNSLIKIKKPLDYIKFYMDNSKLKGLIDFNYNFDRTLKKFVNDYGDRLKNEIHNCQYSRDI
jgi:nucleoside-diphosphate-sugar epimerase